MKNERIVGGGSAVVGGGASGGISSGGGLTGGAREFVRRLDAETTKMLREMKDRSESELEACGLYRDLGKGMMSSIKKVLDEEGSPPKKRGRKPKGTGGAISSGPAITTITQVPTKQDIREAQGGAKGKPKAKRVMSDKMKKRGEAVRRIMKEKGLKLGEASKYVKEHPEEIK